MFVNYASTSASLPAKAPSAGPQRDPEHLLPWPAQLGRPPAAWLETPAHLAAPQVLCAVGAAAPANLGV